MYPNHIVTYQRVTKHTPHTDVTSSITLPTNPTHLLDLLLTYLWRVHGVDYYGGREYGGPDDPTRVGARRALRPPLDATPIVVETKGGKETQGDAMETGDQGAWEGAVKKDGGEGGEGDGDGNTTSQQGGDAAAAGAIVKTGQQQEEEEVKALDELWSHRLDMEDVLEKPLQKQRVEDAIQEWVDAQVVKHDENKYVIVCVCCVLVC